MTRLQRLLRVLLPVLLLLCMLPVAAQETLIQNAAAPAPAPVAPPPPPSVPETLKSPRATIGTFLSAMNDIKRGKPERIEEAISTLDLSEVSNLIRNERGRDLAWMLLEVMDRTRIVGVGSLSNRTSGKPYIFQRYQTGVVRVSLTANGRWLFDKETVAKLPDILDELADKAKVKGKDKAGDDEYLPWHMRIRAKLPESLKKVIFLLENWQWIGILTVIVFGVVLDKLLSLLLRSLVRLWRSRSRHAEFQEISDQILRPLGLMAMAIFWWAGVNLLGLPAEAMLILLVAVKFLAGFSGVWAAYRLVDLLGAYLMAWANKTDNKLDDVLFPLIPRSLKIFVTVIGAIFVADNLNMDTSSLLAGLGLGGLAFALAAKDMVQNLFGSVTILMDRTFSVGDWIIVGDIEGTVEGIGFRSTRIRTFYNSAVTVPNALFITAEVDNMGERRYRRLKCNLGLTYDTPPDRIEAFCEGVRELVRQHPYMRKDYYHVYLNQYAASSLDVLVYVFWETPDWSTELRERHRFMLDVLRLAQRLHVEFAFPTQTLLMKQEEGASEAVVEQSQDKAFEAGRREAQAIVAETTGTGVKPLPVNFK
ncbi:Potassium efflux system KefA protein / Small-conductance mechanosensitive channel [hydrothermal vent metagenome]|uniref:Potassium efflux system KefA protein / Small-conductance mechanosensitive channel n=1 Tax=hydrothermal vent metagenome TaxID=652676 RepID=A0A3B1BBA0_9ZZZZ